MNEAPYTIDELNAWVYKPRMVRKYQLLLVTKKVILVNIAGTIYKVVSCRAYKAWNQLLVTVVDTNQQKVLQSDLIGTGYELKPELVPPETHKWPDMAQDVCIVVGHNNFAHFMWNHLSGLLELPSGMVNVHQQSCADIVDCSRIAGVNIRPRVNIHKDLTLYVGSMYVSTRCKDMLQSQHDTSNQPKGKKFTISLGVRGSRVRGITNEFALYREFLQYIRSSTRQYTVYIDGVTLFEHTTPYVQSVAEELELEISKLIESYPDLDIRSLNKIHIKEWIQLAKNIDYYVTHVGTMDSKYNYIFSNKPGTLIGYTSSAYIKWNKQHICTTGKTCDIPLNLYNVNAVPGEVRRNHECSIIDLQKAVRYIVKNMRESKI